MGTRSLVPILFWSLLTLLIHMLTCLETNGFSIKLIPRYSIDSILFPKNLSQQEKHNRLVELSKARALHFQSMYFVDTINSTKQGIQGIQPIMRSYEILFAVKVAIGTPPYEALLSVDTGSDDTWVQGEGCDKCFKIIDGNFKYKESMTYAMVPCDHPLCVPRICVDNICHYSITYADGDFTEGYLSSETFKFPYNEDDEISFENVIFGVGMKNAARPFMRNYNKIAGIFALGHGPRSILRQLKEHTQLRFSYCLFDFTSEQDIYTYLHFGEDAKIIENDQGRVKTTVLLPIEYGYYVEVFGITMNGALLEIERQAFQMRPDRSGGFIIDTGTTYTYLVPNAYNVVRKAVVGYLQQYKWNPMVNSGLHFDLCYDVQPTKNQQFPSLGIKFLGAILELGSHRVFKLIGGNIYCMFIKPTTSEDDLNVLGAYQQQDFRFLFDVEVGVMQFVPEKCQFN